MNDKNIPNSPNSPLRLEALLLKNIEAVHCRFKGAWVLMLIGPVVLKLKSNVFNFLLFVLLLGLPACLSEVQKNKPTSNFNPCSGTYQIFDPNRTSLQYIEQDVNRLGLYSTDWHLMRCHQNKAMGRSAVDALYDPMAYNKMRPDIEQRIKLIKESLGVCYQGSETEARITKIEQELEDLDIEFTVALKKDNERQQRKQDMKNRLEQLKNKKNNGLSYKNNEVYLEVVDFNCGEDEAQIYLEIEMIVNSKTKFIEPITTYLAVSDGMGMPPSAHSIPRGFSLFDNYGNEYRLKDVLPRLSVGLSSNRLSCGDSRIIKVWFEGAPIKTANYLIVKVEAGTLGNASVVQFKIPFLEIVSTHQRQGAGEVNKKIIPGADRDAHNNMIPEK